AIALLVHVESVAARRKPGELGGDGHLVALLSKRDGALRGVPGGWRDRRRRGLRVRARHRKACRRESRKQKAHPRIAHCSLLVDYGTVSPAWIVVEVIISEPRDLAKRRSAAREKPFPLDRQCATLCHPRGHIATRI